MQIAPEIRAFVLPRGSAWLRAALGRIGHSTNDLARELRDARRRRGEDVDDGAVPRALVRCWVSGTKAISADSAFAVGDALAHLGHPYVGGIFAVVAIGHFLEFAQTIGALSCTYSGASLATEVIYAVPLVAEIDATPPDKIGIFNDPGGIVDNARSILVSEKGRFNAPIIEQAWQRRAQRHHYESSGLQREAALLSLAVSSAQARDVPVRWRWESVIFHLNRWAGRNSLNQNNLPNLMLQNLISIKGATS